MEYFKGDELELKFYNAAAPTLDDLSADKDDFAAGAYSAAPLGDVLYESGRSPLANAIAQDIFRIAFKEIFEAFVVAGSLESYLTVFRKIFGEDVDVTFTIPALGKLLIDIEADEAELTNFVAKEIVDNDYQLNEVIDDEDDNIAFQTIKGFESQYELEQMLFELVPAGIYTEITLTIGGA